MEIEGRSVYEALGVDKNATQADIRKAYLKLAVALHPDKNGNNEEATRRFQTLQQIYGVLGDPERRKVYDQTGSLEDTELAGETFNELYEYYRGLYVKVTEDDISKFQRQYRGSEEEKQDVLQYYSQFKGDMNKVFEWVMCSDSRRDSHRFMDIIDAAVSSKSVQAYKSYNTWSKQIQKRARPADPFACNKVKKAGRVQADELALVAKIRNKQQSTFGSMISRLTDKYGKGIDRDSDREGEPTEEEFAAARQRLDVRNKKPAARNKAAKRSKLK